MTYTQEEIAVADGQLKRLHPVLGTYYPEIQQMQLQLNEARLMLRGVLQSPAMTLAQRVDMIRDMREFLERTEA